MRTSDEMVWIPRELVRRLASAAARSGHDDEIEDANQALDFLDPYVAPVIEADQ